VELEWSSRDPVPILVAGYGPRALRLAGRIGDGVIIQIADPSFVEWDSRSSAREPRSRSRP
jgi:alkanesulfonate monooxygenase SsuD/methylene tetrahydromethanopterin reductase-like flavin-dependent oxidoreductase (luciferase family)